MNFMENTEIEMQDMEQEDVGTQEGTEAPKLYSEEEFQQKLNERLDELIPQKIQRKEAKLRKEYDGMYGGLMDVLKAGTGKESVEEITDTFRQHYAGKGVKVPERSPYSDDDIRVLARNDADGIIQGGYDEVKEELDRLSRVGSKNMSSREKAVFSALAQYRQNADRGRELSQIGVTEDVYGSEEFRTFADKFNASTPTREIYDLYAKTHNTQKEIKNPGSMKNDPAPDIVQKCTMLQVFDNRVFFSGNPDHPNVLWHCSLNDPGYVSDLDYYEEGMDNAAIRGMVAGNNALWVFREPSSANTTVFYHTPTLDEDYGKIYPSCHSSVTTGCVGGAINFNDDIIFFSERGMEGISGDVTTEQVVAHRSSLVDRKLVAEDDYRDMILTEWEGYLLVIIGNHIYLADSRTAFTYENHIEYEWYCWEMLRRITCVAIENGILYMGTDEGIFTLTDEYAPVISYWVTPKDKFKYPHRMKTTNKRGCITECSGDIDLYVRTDEDDFELIGSYANISDYFAARIKRKKFKDIQLKFYSGRRFSLEMTTLECFIGGYIKR